MKLKLEGIQQLAQLIKELSNAFRNLGFDNFASSEKIEVTIAASSEAQIRNPLQYVPTSYLVLKQSGNGLITKESDWDSNYLYLTNNGAVEVTATVIFLR